jgi:hypothetical protein
MVRVLDWAMAGAAVAARMAKPATWAKERPFMIEILWSIKSAICFKLAGYYFSSNPVYKPQQLSSGEFFGLCPGNPHIPTRITAGNATH